MSFQSRCIFRTTDLTVSVLTVNKSRCRNVLQRLFRVWENDYDVESGRNSCVFSVKTRKDLALTSIAWE